MTENPDHNALLLQVMAHDLLAPLTAIKWQTELLEKNYTDTEKRERYFKGLSESTELGIAISKHAHVAGKVLSHTYEGDIAQANFSAVISEAVSDMRLQYERHALVLREDIAREEMTQEMDVALTKLYVWAVAKFFLTCSLPQTEVVMKGARSTDTEKTSYVFVVSAPHVANAQEYVQTLLTQEKKGEFDQSAVFSKLINEVAAILEVSMIPQEEAGELTITSTF